MSPLTMLSLSMVTCYHCSDLIDVPFACISCITRLLRRRRSLLECSPSYSSIECEANCDDVVSCAGMLSCPDGTCVNQLGDCGEEYAEFGVVVGLMVADEMSPNYVNNGQLQSAYEVEVTLPTKYMHFDLTFVDCVPCQTKPTIAIVERFWSQTFPCIPASILDFVSILWNRRTLCTKVGHWLHI